MMFIFILTLTLITTAITTDIIVVEKGWNNPRVLSIFSTSGSLRYDYQPMLKDQLVSLLVMDSNSYHKLKSNGSHYQVIHPLSRYYQKNYISLPLVYFNYKNFLSPLYLVLQTHSQAPHDYNVSIFVSHKDGEFVYIRGIIHYYFVLTILTVLSSVFIVSVFYLIDILSTITNNF